jgi:hypothetical protein
MADSAMPFRSSREYHRVPRFRQAMLIDTVAVENRRL